MPSERLTALLVEDNPDDADLLRETLADTRAAVRLEAVETLAEALERLGRERFDLVLLDLSLPDSQGLATVERTLAHTRRVPILVLTGLEDEVLGATAVHAGAQDYLVKGQADGAALIRSMRYAIERHRLLAAQTADAEVWAALARAGEALLGVAAGSALLERMCKVAVDELHCETSSVWILDGAEASYVPAAAHPPAAWQCIEELHVPRGDLEASAPDGGREEAVRWLKGPDLPLLLVPGGEASEILCLGLARGEELIGVQVCGYRESPSDRNFTQRVARGFVHLATMALSNARLFDELERSNTIKTYFAATMSHELRNTLFAIGGFGDMLVEALDASDGNPARLARTISTRARDSLAMIQAALELTRSEVRPPSPDVGEVTVSELLQQLAEEIHVPSDKADLQVEWDVPEGLPGLRTDAIKLAMVLKNLIGNAIKFTERGVIRISVGPADSGLSFVVADSGVGIDPSELPRLFEPFHQAHGRRSRRAGGAGLGLYIVSRLVELLGGTVTVDSRPGSGTVFTVTVPLAPPASA